MSDPDRALEDPPGRRPYVWTTLAAGVLSVLLALLWLAIAPTPAVRVAGEVVVSDAVPEFAAAQDSLFALLAIGAGLVHGVVALAVGRARLAVMLVAVAAGAAGSLVAWRLGVLLGPAPLAVQRVSGGALVAPLALQALGVLGLWPAVAALTVFVGLLPGGLRGR